MTLTRAEVADFFLRNNHFTIITHCRPDGDTVGSSAALCLALRQLGKTAAILENPELTPKYAHLHQGLTKPCAEAGDILVSVDVAATRMLPVGFSGQAIALRLDHHETCDSFTEFELVEPEAAACGEVIYSILQLLGVDLDKAMANALYTAISTDTGCFRYANTRENTFRVAAACTAAGADIFSINQALFDTNSLGRLRLQGWIVENALFLANGTAVVCPLPTSVEENLGLCEDDMENISGFPRSIEGVKIAATLRQDGNRIKVSIRAIPGYDAGAICQKFGGGGHKGAAGASLNMDMEQAVTAISQAILEYL